MRSDAIGIHSPLRLPCAFLSYREEAGAKEGPPGQHVQHLGLGLAGAQVADLLPAGLDLEGQTNKSHVYINLKRMKNNVCQPHHVNPLRWLDVPGGECRLGQQELCLLDARLVLHVGGPVQQRGHPGDVVDELLLDLLAGHHQEEALQVVGGDLIEHHLDV